MTLTDEEKSLFQDIIESCPFQDQKIGCRGCDRRDICISLTKKIEDDLDKQDSTKNSPIKDPQQLSKGEKGCKHKNTNQIPEHPHDVYCEDCGLTWSCHEDPPPVNEGEQEHYKDCWCLECQNSRNEEEDVSLIGRAEEADAEEKDFK